MTRLPPSRSNSNAGLIIGLWLGLTLVAGIGIFALIYWAMGGFDAATPAPTALPVAISTTVPPTAPPAASATPSGSGGGGETSACNYPPLPASGFGYGIQSHVFGGGPTELFMGMIREKLSLQWVKIQVRWNDMEKTPGNVEWGTLDHAMSTACAKGVRVMFSVVAAPDWTHTNPMPAPEGQEAPPDDYNVYANFVGQLVDRDGQQQRGDLEEERGEEPCGIVQQTAHLDAGGVSRAPLGGGGAGGPRRLRAGRGQAATPTPSAGAPRAPPPP